MNRKYLYKNEKRNIWTTFSFIHFLNREIAEILQCFLRLTKTSSWSRSYSWNDPFFRLCVITGQWCCVCFGRTFGFILINILIKKILLSIQNIPNKSWYKFSKLFLYLVGRNWCCTIFSGFHFLPCWKRKIWRWILKLK